MRVSEGAVESGAATVLILERSQTFVMFLALLLRRMGLQTESVATVAAAQARLGRGGVNILLVGEPGDGCSISAAVRQLADDPVGKRLPLVVVGVRDDADEQQACLAAGCRAYLLRPVQPRQLHQALQAHLRFAAGERQHLRSSVAIEVTGVIGSGERRLLRLLSLSRGGALVAHAGIVAVGTPVALTLPLPAGPLPLSGTVIYNRRDPAAGTPFAFAVQFHREGHDCGEQIDAFLETLLHTECSPQKAGEG
jgi:twitching motility two-component system response regulator PilH